MKAVFPLFLIFCLFPPFLYAKCDSLAKAIESTTGTEQVDAYNEYARCFLSKDYKSADSLTQIAYEKAEKIDYRSGMARSNQNFGLILRYRDENEEGSFDYFSKSLELYEAAGDSLGAGTALGDLAGSYRRKGELGAALETSIRALTIFEAEGFERGISLFSNNIGSLFMTTSDAEEAIPYFRRALQLVDTLRDRQNYSVQLSNLLTASILLENEDSVKHYFNKVLYVQKSEDLDDYVAATYSNMQSYYQDILEVENPIFRIRQNYADSAYFYANKSGDKIEMAIANFHKGLLLTLEGQNQLATPFLEKAVEYGSNQALIAEEMAESHFLLSEIALKAGNFKKSREELGVAYKMMEEINAGKIEKTVLETKARYQVEQSRKELALIKKEKALTDLKLQNAEAENERKEAVARKDRILLYAAAAGFVVALLFIVFIYRAYQTKKRNNQLVLEQKEEVELQRAEAELQKSIAEEHNREILDSITYAQRIQRAILPSEKIIETHLSNAFVLYKPKEIISGDFYWVDKKGDTVLFAVADCTGHGVPGAMVSVVCSNGLSRAVNEFGKTAPGKILDRTAQLITKEFSKNRNRVADGMDIALCSLTGKTLKFAGAKRPLWICRNGEIIEINGDNRSIKTGLEIEPFTEQTIALETNDVIYLFSNGFVDQFGGEEGKKLKLSNLRRFVIAMYSFESFKQKVMIDKAFEDWKGGMEQMDDVCMLGVKILD